MIIFSTALGSGLDGIYIKSLPLQISGAGFV